MMLDQNLVLSDAQALTVTANSTNVIDLGAAKSLGAGDVLIPMVLITAVGGTSPTLTVTIQGADDVGISTNVITLATATPTLVSGTAYGFVRMAFHAHMPKRYIRATYTLGGTSPTMTITTSIVEDQQTEYTRAT
jgi:hypothetical protein